jgi:hypothetical protein
MLNNVLLVFRNSIVREACLPDEYGFLATLFLGRRAYATMCVQKNALISFYCYYENK